MTHPGWGMSDSEVGGFGVPGSAGRLCGLGCARGGDLLDAGAALPSVTTAGKAAAMGTLLQTQVLWSGPWGGQVALGIECLFSAPSGGKEGHGQW